MPESLDVVVLIHGFGASCRHWRHTIPGLCGGAEVLAIDLLGFGSSDKPRAQLQGEVQTPGSVRYCFQLWAQQVVDLIRRRLPETDAPGSADDRKIHLIGNSIGGMVALTAALQLRSEGHSPYQVILLDCAQRMLDDKRLSEQPILAQLGRPLLKQIIRQRWVTDALFGLLAKPQVIRRVLKQAYPSGRNVDEELIHLLYEPTTDPGARESFRGFVNLFSDYLAPELLEQLSDSAAPKESGPVVRMIWGQNDPWENPDEARAWANRYSCIKELRVLPEVGHCPHDEAPDLVNPILRSWVLGVDP